MEKLDQQEERLLEQDSDAGEEDARSRNTMRKGVRQHLPVVVSCLLVVSIVWNVVLIGTIRTLGVQKGGCRSDFGKILAYLPVQRLLTDRVVAGLEDDKTIPYQMMTDFMDQNRSVSDVLWTDLDAHPILVALDSEYITAHDLRPSAQCPQDDSKQLYQVKALHHIHCLVSSAYPMPKILVFNLTTSSEERANGVLRCLGRQVRDAAPTRGTLS
jgi:hypothetical protein